MSGLGPLLPPDDRAPDPSSAVIDRVDPERLLGLWVQLARIESGSHDRAGLNEMGVLMSDRLASAGCSVAAGPRTVAGAQSVVATRPGRGRTIMLLGHLDTVWPPGTLSTFPVVMDGSRIHGPGVADMKGGLAVIVEALLATMDEQEAAPVVVILTADEELGTPTGRKAIDDYLPRCDGALVFESARAGGRLISARRGSAILELEVLGKTAHVAHDASAGINAVDELAHQLLRLQELRDPESGTSVMAGVISGGTARQVIPDRATALIDVRARTDDELNRVIGSITASAQRPSVDGAVVTVSGGVTRRPLASEPTSWLHRALEASASRISLPIGYTAVGGGSDANLVAAHGVPVVDGLGPEGFSICSREESADIPSASARAKLVAGLLSAELPGDR